MFQGKIVFRLLFLALILGGGVFPQIAVAQDTIAAAHEESVQRLVDEALNSGSLDVLDSLLAPDYVNHGLGSDMILADFKAYIASWQAALPDFQATVEILIAEDEWAASRQVFTGTFSNDWVMGDKTITANDQPVRWSLNILHRFDENGQIVEDFIAADQLDLLTQLGASPLPRLIADVLPTGTHAPAVQGESVTHDMEAGHKEGLSHVIGDALNYGDLTAIDTYMSADYRTHEPFGDFSRDQFKSIVETFRATVPDLQVTIDPSLAEGDWLAARLIYVGTFANGLTVGNVSVEPTGRPIHFVINVFVHFNAAGIGDQDYKEYNRLAWLQQAGLLPTSPSS